MNTNTVNGEGLFSVERRSMLKSLLMMGVAGCLLPMASSLPALADDVSSWPKDAFSKKNQTDALRTLYKEEPAPSDKISLDAPEIAENGAVVPVSVQTTLPNVTSISILVPNNPFTLAASYTLPAGTTPNVSCRLKMGKTSDVVAVVESDGKLYRAKKQVKVTLGGCGG